MLLYLSPTWMIGCPMGNLEYLRYMGTMSLYHNTELFLCSPLSYSEDSWPLFDPRTGHRVCLEDCWSQLGVLGNSRLKW